MSFLWDLIQQRQLRKLQLQQDSSKDDVVELKSGFRNSADLAIRYEHLSLVCQAMWELLSERLGIFESELAERVNDIDLRDQKLDGKLARNVTCQQCHRPVNPTRSLCIICGAALERNSVWDKC